MFLRNNVVLVKANNKTTMNQHKFLIAFVILVYVRNTVALKHRPDHTFRYGPAIFDMIFGDGVNVSCDLIKSFNTTSDKCTTRLVEVCKNKTLRLKC